MAATGVVRRDRRAVLLGGAALVAAGCGTPARPAPDDGGFAPGAPLPGGAGGGPGTVVGPATAVPVGGGVVDPRLAVVVTRPTDTTYRGFSAVCPHDGCLVSEVVAATIVCPCHGSRFSLDGAVVRGPAATALAARPVRVDGDRVVLA
ncbi:Rieske (2Fe-2S) protein [Actinomycetospora chiangmaiensis]|uniref:Rieske (2Fe-2S) protein n=1 Tax=Actinomycetospora chiangmaiensis TaxID=402650 RepID=UPI00035E53E7|nr:Rieske (2Fe-2S) protein [Actinomycetospora chiangmaiensis]